MTAPEPEPREQIDLAKLIWPAVVAFIAALGAVTAILVFVPASNAIGAQAVVSILGMLGSALGSVFVLAHVRAVRKDVAVVKNQVNGRMSQLIEAKTQPDLPAVPEKGTAS